MSELGLYWWQRLSAMVLAPLVVVHLVTMLFAIRGGLSAGEILERTQGSWVWAAFYLLFVLAAAVHAPIGLRNVAREWTPWSGRGLDVAAVALGLALAALGGRAVWAVFA